MICPQCGAEALDEQTQCTKCGSPLSEPVGPLKASEGHSAQQEEKRPERNVKCVNCGEHNVEGAVYCGRCGLLTSRPKECPACHAPIAFIDRYCTACGKLIRPGTIAKRSVRPLAALILGLVPGLFSIWGVGHFFAGSPNRGFGFFLLGILMGIVGPITLVLFAQNIGDLILLAVVGVIVWFGLWLFQSVDAYWEAGGE